jgi:N-acetylgalactosamine-6-sulfatase
MKSARSLAFFSALLCALCASALNAFAAARPPNIIFLFADDLGWGDLACYGHPYAKTPNLDRLASEGTRFTQCYATGVTCCPSRTGFMTSKLPATFKGYPANAGFSGRVTVSELLKRQGYATGHFGKWHIGPETKAGTYGFDVIGADADDETGGKRKAVRTERGRDAHIYDLAIRFIEQHKDGPFYVNLWGHVSHHPVNPSPTVLAGFPPLQVDETKFPPEMREKFALCKKLGGDVNAHLRAYLADVKSMDDDAGRLLKRLDELGLRENTIVVFSSDQGPAPLRDPSAANEKQKAKAKARFQGDGAPGSDVRLNAMGFAGPFRGGKHTQYEGGVRIPFIVRWPGHVTAGRVDEKSVLSGADWLPTLGTLAGAKFNAADCDGENTAAAWLGQPFTRSKPLLWKTSSPRAGVAIREADWKLHWPNGNRGDVELYDLARDAREAQNVAAQNPGVVKSLTAKVEQWNATLPTEYIKADDKLD